MDPRGRCAMGAGHVAVRIDPKNIRRERSVGGGAQADTVYAYYPQMGVYRSLDAGAPGTWTEIWATRPSQMLRSSWSTAADPTTLWVTAEGGLYELENAATATLSTYTTLLP